MQVFAERAPLFPFALSLSKGSPERIEGASPAAQQEASTSLSPNGFEVRA
jgi:hypothetical protein